jgi:DNA polymerase-3 subunit alpha
MINLIKAGAFDEIETDLHSRKEIMAYYLYKASEPKKRITLQNWSGLVSYNLVPKELELQIRVFNFNKYLKSINKGFAGDSYRLNNICISFFEKHLTDVLDNIEEGFVINKKFWDNFYQTMMDPAREWIKANQSEILETYNQVLFKEIWDKYASGTTSSWEMDALCFYHGEHELKDINVYKYDIADFFELKSNEVEYYFKKGNAQIPIYKLYRIIGTVISKNDTTHIVTLLTTTGVVNVKFSKEYYAMFKRQISQPQADGTKKVIEKSWFKRGTKLMVTGFRRDDQFVGKTYSSTQTHQLYKITDIIGDEMKLQHERMTAQGTIEEDYED